MRKKICKPLSLLLAFAMSMSLFSVPAFAAEATETTVSEDGRTTTITTEITWTSPEGEEPVVEARRSQRRPPSGTMRAASSRRAAQRQAMRPPPPKP